MRKYPSLRLFDPRSFYNSWVYAILNVVLGIYFMSVQPGIHSNIVSGILSYTLWGIIWMFSGIVLGYFILKNDWVKIKHTLTVFLFFKTFWAIALVVYGINHGFIDILGSLGIWVALFALQVITCMYFIDHRTVGVGNGSAQ